MEATFQTRDPAQLPAATRLMPLYKQDEIFARDRAFYEKLQRELASDNGSKPSAVLIAACQDNQVASDGAVNGLFTEKLLNVWNQGGFRGGYREFHRDIQKRMPAIQSPNFYTTGSPSPDFLQQKPFTI